MPQGALLVIMVGGLMFLILAVIVIITHFYTLDSIKNKTVGNGQYGTARFATKREVLNTYKHIPYQPNLWRQGRNLPNAQGLIVGSKVKGGATTALVDTQDIHALMIGAAGIGKTACFLYPNLEYACASGMSFLCTDTKGVRPDRA